MSHVMPSHRRRRISLYCVLLVVAHQLCVPFAAPWDAADLSHSNAVLGAHRAGRAEPSIADYIRTHQRGRKPSAAAQRKKGPVAREQLQTVPLNRSPARDTHRIRPNNAPRSSRRIGRFTRPAGQPTAARTAPRIAKTQAERKHDTVPTEVHNRPAPPLQMPLFGSAGDARAELLGPRNPRQDSSLSRSLSTAINDRSAPGPSVSRESLKFHIKPKSSPRVRAETFGRSLLRPELPQAASRIAETRRSRRQPIPWDKLAVRTPEKETQEHSVPSQRPSRRKPHSVAAAEPSPSNRRLAAKAPLPEQRSAAKWQSRLSPKGLANPFAPTKPVPDETAALHPPAAAAAGSLRRQLAKINTRSNSPLASRHEDRPEVKRDSQSPDPSGPAAPLAKSIRRQLQPQSQERPPRSKKPAPPARPSLRDQLTAINSPPPTGRTKQRAQTQSTEIREQTPTRPPTVPHVAPPASSRRQATVAQRDLGTGRSRPPSQVPASKSAQQRIANLSRRAQPPSAWEPAANTAERKPAATAPRRQTETAQLPSSRRWADNGSTAGEISSRTPAPAATNSTPDARRPAAETRLADVDTAAGPAEGSSAAQRKRQASSPQPAGRPSVKPSFSQPARHPAAETQPQRQAPNRPPRIVKHEPPKSELPRRSASERKELKPTPPPSAAPVPSRRIIIKEPVASIPPAHRPATAAGNRPRVRRSGRRRPERFGASLSPVRPRQERVVIAADNYKQGPAPGEANSPYPHQPADNLPQVPLEYLVDRGRMDSRRSAAPNSTPQLAQTPSTAPVVPHGIDPASPNRGNVAGSPGVPVELEERPPARLVTRAPTLTAPTASSRRHNEPNSAPPQLATDLETRIAAQVAPHVQYATDLAARGALYSAKDEFVTALKAVAQALDEEYQTERHRLALESGLTALREANDFYSRDGRHPSGGRVRQLTEAHRTPVGKQNNAVIPSRRAAVQAYCDYASEQLQVAGGGQPVASRALSALAQLHVAVAPDNRSKRLQAIALHRAALLVDGRNRQAAQELENLLAN